MRYDPNKHHRRSIRLKGYDYTQAGVYFVTIVTQNRACLFGDIVAGEVRLNAFGQAVAETWLWLATQYGYVELDEWVVMPNHLHGIVVITGTGDGRPADGGRWCWWRRWCGGRFTNRPYGDCDWWRRWCGGRFTNRPYGDCIDRPDG
jgi:REP element-mobilizing transposase RayT